MSRRETISAGPGGALMPAAVIALAATAAFVQGTPNLEWLGSWNDRAVALLGCAIFDVFSGREAGRAGGRRHAG